jgi:hypothetical protein
VASDVFSIMMTNTCEKSGMPVAERQTSMPLAVPQVEPVGQPPQGAPLELEALVLELLDAELELELEELLAPPAPPAPVRASVPLLPHADMAAPSPSTKASRFMRRM